MSISNQYHILPINDSLPHRPHPQCDCKPEVKIMPDESKRWFHNAFDEREQFEDNGSWTAMDEDGNTLGLDDGAE